MKVAILTLVHNLHSQSLTELWGRTLKNLALTNLPIFLYGDHTCPKWAHKAMDFYPNITVNFDAPDTEWGKVQYGLDHIDADWIAICHQDDLWIQNKIKEQLKWITPSTPIIATGYLQLNDNYEYIWKFPVPHSEYGVIDSMPSTWLINRKLVKEIPDPFPELMCKDLGIFLTLNQLGKIIVIQNPYVVYNHHLENGGHILTDEQIKNGRDAMKNYAKTLKPNFQYVWGTTR